MTDKGGPDLSLLRLLPPVLRARDFRLYTGGGGGDEGRGGGAGKDGGNKARGGNRLVDLWQEGGAAILGHTPPGFLRELKNTAGRGLFTPLPHPLEKRLLRALSRLFPRRSFRVYAPGTSLSGLLTAAGLPRPAAVADPAVPRRPGGDGPAILSLWRPFPDPAAPLAVPEGGAPILVPVLPGAGWGRPSGPLILALDPAFEEEHPLPPPDLVSPVTLAVLTRGIYGLIAAAPERGKCPFPKIRAALAGGPWERRGIYLSLREASGPAAWEGLFRRFLAGGFLIPPCSAQPLILPGVLSLGEEAKLAGLLAGYPAS
ncbi:MAG: hypothetical protein LBS06_03850 [Treponema sp.]|jgi:hypothetical protein|nr:hypothetical protein [Treponema sp.]